MRACAGLHHHIARGAMNPETLELGAVQPAPFDMRPLEETAISKTFLAKSTATVSVFMGGLLPYECGRFRDYHIKS